MQEQNIEELKLKKQNAIERTKISNRNREYRRTNNRFENRNNRFENRNYAERKFKNESNMDNYNRFENRNNRFENRNNRFENRNNRFENRNNRFENRNGRENYQYEGRRFQGKWIPNDNDSVNKYL